LGLEKGAGVGIETEIKIHLASGEAFLRKLQMMDSSILSTRHFEDNWVLDYPDSRLRSSGCLLRVRSAGDRSYLTYKGPQRAGGKFKVREEFEIAVEDGKTVLLILEKLGLRVWFRYQKYRSEYSVAVPDSAGDRIHVTYDETPVGIYAELEGSEEGIRRIAGAMGIDDSSFIRDSYYTIYARACRERGRVPGNMIFPEESNPKGEAG
jgi:adenylate cyclase class 2